MRINEWHLTVARKRAARTRRQRQKQKPNELKYPQRQISDADYDDIFIDFDDEGSD